VVVVAMNPASLDWVWLSGPAIDEFKRWRIEAGATSASASSYATGAREFVRYCRRSNSAPTEAADAFHDHLTRAGDLSPAVRSDYRSHARAFARFLVSRQTLRATRTPEKATGTGDAAPPEPGLDREGPSEAMVVRVHSAIDGEARSTAELLAGYAQTLAILRERGVIRTGNAPSGDYAEWLVWRAFGGTIEPNSTKSHDVTDADGRRLQVKARLVSEPPTSGQLQTSVFRSWDFDFAVLVQLGDNDYSVKRASLVPAHVFEQGAANARWSDHVNGWAVFMTPQLMNHPEALDVTATLRAISQEG
jgi:hypothetical protein